VEASHISVWRWVQRLEGMRLEVKPRRRRMVALDETKLKDAGQPFHIWVAIDLRTRELLALRASCSEVS